jgi:ribonucleoside-diphosphate reductase beta chain
MKNFSNKKLDILKENESFQTANINPQSRVFFTIKDNVKYTSCVHLKPVKIKSLRVPQYPVFLEAWQQQLDMVWVPTEISMQRDKRDWMENISAHERQIIKMLLRLFTQNEVEVNDLYTTKYPTLFQPMEVLMTCSAFAFIETVHMVGYNYLSSSLLSDVEQQTIADEFVNYKEMIDKYNYMHTFSLDTPFDVAKTILVFGAFVEGLFLYASFAMFLYFSEVRKVLNGVGQIITWSMRDETLHVQTQSVLFKTFMKEVGKENPEIYPLLETVVYDCCKQMVKLETEFVDLVFQEGDLEGMKKEDIKEYIKFLADFRLEQFGFHKMWNVTKNPLPWMNTHIGTVEKTDFFQNTVVEYQKNSTSGEWEY